MPECGARPGQRTGVAAAEESSMLTILLLTASNIFMTFAWYGHLRFKDAALWKLTVLSWVIAFFEYCLMVPANRWGHGQFTASQRKTIQEVVTLGVFRGFSIWYLREPVRWNTLVGFGFIAVGAGSSFVGRRGADPAQPSRR
jgi:uncharacterized protein (DUF486 family)